VTGFAVFDNKELIKYGVFDLSDMTESVEKINTMKVMLHKLIETYNPDKILLEDIQLQHNNVKVFKVLSELRGVLVDYLFENEIPYEIIMPTTWKSRIGINTRLKRDVQKRLTQEFVKNKFGIEVSEDIADSISIGFVCVNK
jgi:Holliday junction resolvasome RuvABC endonuclease subunit